MQELGGMIEAGMLKSEDITEGMISDHLMTGKFGEYQDPDLLIRTSGEQRISNFFYSGNWLIQS